MRECFSKNRKDRRHDEVLRKMKDAVKYEDEKPLEEFNVNDSLKTKKSLQTKKRKSFLSFMRRIGELFSSKSSCVNIEKLEGKTGNQVPNNCGKVVEIIGERFDSEKDKRIEKKEIKATRKRYNGMVNIKEVMKYLTPSTIEEVYEGEDEVIRAGNDAKEMKEMIKVIEEYMKKIRQYIDEMNKNIEEGKEIKGCDVEKQESTVVKMDSEVNEKEMEKDWKEIEEIMQGVEMDLIERRVKERYSRKIEELEMDKRVGGTKDIKDRDAEKRKSAVGENDEMKVSSTININEIISILSTECSLNR